MNYTPVNCNFYDELEALATLGKRSEIIFLADGARVTVTGVIKDLYTRDGVEYLKMDSGLVIRLDQLAQVDGKIPSNYC